jgi:hypothetical protein
MEIESTNKRIDDLIDRMAEGFNRVYREIDVVSKRMSESFERIDREIASLAIEIREIRSAQSD